MKLDYLQYLELEVFTRFGARLEASMEQAIARGRVLREILKQDRLAPQEPEFHLAWLVAFNDGLFKGVPLDQVAERLARLEHGVEAGDLGLDSPRAAWSRALADWMGSASPGGA